MIILEWNANDPRASSLTEWEFFHEHARQVFLMDGTYLKILFILADTGTVQPVSISARPKCLPFHPYKIWLS